MNRSPVDISVLQRLQAALGGETAQAVVHELVTMYVSETSTMLEQLRDAVDQQDGMVCERLSHTMKSNSIQMGARFLASLCRELEHEGPSGDSGNAVVLVVRVEAEFERVKLALERFLNR